MGADATEVTPTAAVSYLPTCNLLVRRDVLLAHGGFDAALRVGEDVDFIWRTCVAAHRAWYAPTGRVVHHHRVQWGDWLRRRADYGSSEADLQQRFPKADGDAPAANQPVIAVERGADAVVRTIGDYGRERRCLSFIQRGTVEETARITANRDCTAGYSNRRRADSRTCSGFLSPERQ
jgi:hypothetical protein